MSLLTRVRNLFRRDAVSDEIDRELAFHLRERAEDLEAAGVPPDAARREARRRFGSVAVQKEYTRDRDVLVSLETLFSDFRYGLRALRRSPIFCLTAILTLAIGIGANTAVFTLLHGLLLRSLPAHAPQELARIGLVNRDNPLSFNVTVPFRLVQELRRDQRSFVDISAWRNWSTTIEAPRGTPRYEVAFLVSGNAFELFGLRPRIGRLLGPADDVPGGPPGGWPVVLSHTLWRDQFGADPGVLGQTIAIRDDVLTIIGVAPAAFHGVVPGFEPAIYLPLQYITRLNGGVDAESLKPPQSVAAIGRLKPGVTFDEANAEMAVLQDRLLVTAMPSPMVNGQPITKALRLTVESARAGLPSIFGRMYSTPLFIMQGLLAVVLLLCCANVSGLMLSKLHERQHEFAVRTAIGAPRFRLMRQYMTESFVIALAGAALGAAAAWYGSVWLLPFFRDPNMAIGMSIQPDQTVFTISAALAVGTTLAFGLVPAWKAGRANPGNLLKSRTAAQRQIAGRSFVAIQVALSLVLVVLATLLSQSLLKLRGEDTGFDLDQVTIQTPPFHLLPQKGEAKLELYQRMVDRIAQGPGVRGAAITWYTPMTGLQSTARFQSQSAAPPQADGLTLAYNSVGPGYFQTMATKILAGREFERQERRRDVCVLNQGAANALFPGQSAIGQYVRTSEPINMPRAGSGPNAVSTLCRVVGVAEDAKFATLREPPPRTIYFPMSADIVDMNMVFLMNATSKSAAMAAYRDAVQEITPTTPLVLFATLREQMDALLGGQRAITFLSTFFGGVALLLSAIGLYGMLSSSVTQRTGEIGIRAALGASRSAIIRMIVSDALRLVAIGCVAGAIGLVFSVRSIESMLYGVGAFDPVTFAAAGLLLLAVVLAATAWPARRAASIDPIEAMRVD